MRIFVAALPFLLSLGCTKGDPGFNVLDVNNVPQPLFGGQTTTTVRTQNKTDTPAISGECDYKIRGITAQIVGVDNADQPLTHISNAAVTVTCQADGKFAFTLKTLADLGFTPTMGSTYEILLRAQTSAGVSKPSSLKIFFADIGGSSRATITSGGTLSSGAPRTVASTNFKAVIRVDHRMPDYASPGSSGAMTTQISSGGSFKAKMGAAANAN